MDNVTLSERQSQSKALTIVTIGTHTATTKNAKIIANCLFNELLRDINNINKAMAHGQEDSVTHPDFVWPDEEAAWNCDSAIYLLIRDLESLKNQRIEITDLGMRFFQIEAALRLMKAVAPVSARYVGRCLDIAIKTANVFGALATDCLGKEVKV